MKTTIQRDPGQLKRYIVTEIDDRDIAYALNHKEFWSHVVTRTRDTVCEELARKIVRSIRINAGAHTRPVRYLGRRTK